jgi:sec-independent protein translocase protein TatC
MTVVDHLTELRRRLVICAVALTVGGTASFLLYSRILRVLIGPYVSATGKTTLYITSPLEGFATRIKIAGYGGLVIALPVILWQLWRFVTPGLHKREKRYAVPFLLSSLVLFAIGGALAWLTFPKALQFLVGVGGHNLETIFSPNSYLSLILLMILAFGLAFEFPVLLVFLELAGVVDSKRLRKWRRPAAVVIFIVAAVITPSQDPYSLFAMAIPMCIFYEASILVGRVLGK